MPRWPVIRALPGLAGNECLEIAIDLRLAKSDMRALGRVQRQASVSVMLVTDTYQPTKSRANKRRAEGKKASARDATPRAALGRLAETRLQLTLTDHVCARGRTCAQIHRKSGSEDREKTATNVLQNADNGMVPDNELHSKIIDRVTRFWSGGTASNHHGMLMRMNSILSRFIDLLDEGGDEGPVGRAMPACVTTQPVPPACSCHSLLCLRTARSPCACWHCAVAG